MPPTSRPGLWRALVALVQQHQTERRLRARDGSFRTTDLRRITRTYGAMSPAEFQRINGAQEWQNWRLVPRALMEMPVDRPWRIIDLGCGSGGSSAVIASTAPAGSTLTGFDVCDALLDEARRRRYVDCEGRSIRASFMCQPITEPLRDAFGNPFADASVDVAHAAGVVGHHLALDDVVRLAAELQRVLAPAGIAVLDAGPKLSAAGLAAVMSGIGMRQVARYCVLPWTSRAVLVFRKQGVGDDALSLPDRRQARSQDGPRDVVRRRIAR